MQAMAAVRPLLLPWPSLLLLLLSLLSSPSSSTAAEDDGPAAAEVAALLGVKSALHDPTSALSSWTNSSTPCDAAKPWTGVVCFHGSVTGLRLGGMGLSGSVDVNALSHLRSLRTISLVSNAFSGAIPDFTRILALKSIYLSQNNFSGAIPDSFFSKMTHMKKLWLNGNSFAGAIPSSVSTLVLLMELHLEDNMFTGAIPDIGVHSLKSFNVSNNKLVGAIPPGLERFGAGSFAGNEGLCGAPLGDKPCANGAVAAEAKEEAAIAAMEATDTKEINSGKTLVVCVVLGILLLALVFVAAIVKKRREGGFETLGVENDYIEGVEVHMPPSSSDSSNESRPESSHGRRNQQGSGHGPRRQEVSKKGSSVADLVMINGDKGSFGLADLMKAAAEVLGNGGLGSAYKAVMATGATVVVKRMKEMNRLTKDVFDMEMRKLGRLRHPNVMMPLAYHYRKEEKLLVFDYIEKGSLLYLLHGDRGPYHAALDWPTRLKIIRGIARGMAYLHVELSGAELPHGNLKSGNVLLGRDFEPLIVDHGYIPLVNPSQAAQVMFAYRSPEFVHYRHVSPKSDVYCLGVVILEVLTGKFPSQYLNNGKGGTDVVQWVTTAVAERREAEVVDPEILAGGAMSVAGGMERLLRLGVALAEPNPERRPDMMEAARRIEDIAADPGRVVAEEVQQQPLVSVGPAPSLKDGCAELAGPAQLTERKSGREGDAGERSATRRAGDDNFEFTIS